MTRWANHLRSRANRLTRRGIVLGEYDVMRKLRHHSLVAWQRADDLFIALHEVARSFPRHELFALSSQMRRAAYSVPANIVEAFARRYPRERLHFLNIAEGSLAEAGYCVHAACRLGYISEQTRVDLS